MGTIYVDTGGNAANSGTSDNNSPDLSGTAASVSGTTITLDSGTILTGVVTTPGPTQSAINLAGATNAQRTVFWITATAGSGGATPTVTVDTTPTGITSGISWRIGGRYVWPSTTTVSVVEGALGFSLGQDIVQFNNTPSTRTTAPYITFRNSGTTTSGLIIIQGKAGVRPKLQITGAAGSVINANNLNNYKISNLELASASPTDVFQNAGGNWLDNILISAGGGIGTTFASGRMTNCEITGCAGDGVVVNGNSNIVGNYIHGNTGSGINITVTTSQVKILDNLIVSNSGRGVFFSATTTSQGHLVTLDHNTIANNTLAGFEVTNINSVVDMRNNIIYENSATHPAVLWSAGTAEWFGSHGYNVFFQAGAGGTTTNLTANSTEFTTDPLFVNAGSGNYAIQSTSPAAGTGYPSVSGGPFPGTGGSASVGYQDIGAFQRQVTAGGGGAVIGS